MRALVSLLGLTVFLFACGSSPTSPDSCVDILESPWDMELISPAGDPVLIPNQTLTTNFYSFEEKQVGIVWIKPSVVSRIALTVVGRVPCPRDLVMTARSPTGKTMLVSSHEGSCEPGNFTRRTLIDHKDLTDLYLEPAQGGWNLLITNSGAAENFTGPNGTAGSPTIRGFSTGSVRTFLKCR